MGSNSSAPYHLTSKATTRPTSRWGIRFSGGSVSSFSSMPRTSGGSAQQSMACHAPKATLHPFLGGRHPRRHLLPNSARSRSALTSGKCLGVSFLAEGWNDLTTSTSIVWIFTWPKMDTVISLTNIETCRLTVSSRNDSVSSQLTYIVAHNTLHLSWILGSEPCEGPPTFWPSVPRSSNKSNNNLMYNRNHI